MEKLSFDDEAAVYLKKKWRVHVTLPSSFVYTFSLYKREKDIYRVFAMTSINTNEV